MSFLLDGRDRRALREILLEAFDRDGLSHALEESTPARVFEDLVANTAFRDQVRELIRVAEREGWLDELGGLLARERSQRPDLVAAARGCIERAAQRAASTMPRRRRTLLNLALTSVLVVLAVSYFFLHLEPLWARLGLFSAISLATVSILSAILAWTRQKEIGTWLRGLVEHPATTRWLGLGCAALLVLTAGTSSLFLLPGSVGGESGPAAVTTDLGLAARFTSPDDRPVGRLFFGRVRATEVRFTVEDPPGHQLDPGKLRPGRSLRIRLPSDLRQGGSTVLRILPGLRLVRRVPRPRIEDPLRPHSLEVSIGGHELESVADLRTHGLFVAASAAEVLSTVRLPQEVLARPLLRRLEEMEVGEADRQGILDDWEGDLERPMIREHTQIGAGAAIRVRILNHRQEVVGCLTETLGEFPVDEIMTLLVEENDDC